MWKEWQDYWRNNQTYNERGRNNTSQEMWKRGRSMRLPSVSSEQWNHTWNRFSRTTCLFYYIKSSFQKMVLPLYSSRIQTSFVIEHTCISVQCSQNYTHANGNMKSVQQTYYINTCNPLVPELNILCNLL